MGFQGKGVTGSRLAPKSQWLSTMSLFLTHATSDVVVLLSHSPTSSDSRIQGPSVSGLGGSFSGSSAPRPPTSIENAGWQSWLLGAGLKVVRTACIPIPLARASLTATLRYQAPGNMAAMC